MTVQDPTLPTPPTTDELAHEPSSTVDVDEDPAAKIVTALEGSDVLDEYNKGKDNFRRQLGHRLKQAQISRSD